MSTFSDRMRERQLSIDIPTPPMPLLPSFPSGVRYGAPDECELVCWLLDTRELWPGQKITSASGAAECLAAITPQERKNICDKLFIADAKMSLGSALLKRLFISKALDIPWRNVRLGRKGDPKHGKPCAMDENNQPIRGLDFNVSHQAGLVTLIGWNGRNSYPYFPSIHSSHPQNGNFVYEHDDYDIMVGADIVCVNERQSASSMIKSEGFEEWVDVYSSVFSDEERWAMKYDIDSVTLSDGTTLSATDLGRFNRCTTQDQHIRLVAPSGQSVNFSSNLLIDAKLRRFYAYFCYKEAFIKLNGEALLAPWLRELEFFNVRTPQPCNITYRNKRDAWGEVVDDVQVRLRGQTVGNVKMNLQAFEENFMLATAIQGDVQHVDIPRFQPINLQQDILPLAIDNLAVKSPMESTPWEAQYI